MGQRIEVDDESLNRLRTALEDAGAGYKANLKRLENLINEITSGDIQGDPANDLLRKYQEKKDMFEGLKRTIDEASEFIGAQTRRFDGMIGELTENMR